VTAEYAGSANFNPSAPVPLTQQVLPPGDQPGHLEPKVQSRVVSPGGRFVTWTIGLRAVDAAGILMTSYTGPATAPLASPPGCYMWTLQPPELTNGRGSFRVRLRNQAYTLGIPAPAPPDSSYPPQAEPPLLSPPETQAVSEGDISRIRLGS